MSDPPQQRPGLGFGLSVPIGALGGLIGLGGAEFRLPVLAGPLAYPARDAITLNLAISLITVTTSLAIRSQTLSLTALEPLVPVIVALTSGAVFSAFFGVGWARRLQSAHLERLIFVLLLAIGLALLSEAFLPESLPPLFPGEHPLRVVVGLAFGLLIGWVSSVLGVAGGELIIPTLVFAFGADIKTAGTSSLLISLPTVLVGVWRHRQHGAYRDRASLMGTVLPMGLGSVLGALLGGLVVGIVPVSWLKVGLGVILEISAWHMFRRGRH